ncbi:hypothetical protein HYR99_38475 [Candidatus Poribacteria bacterium]|nr:hypothetical protein [Candidatus Poribacteria bacterium]
MKTKVLLASLLFCLAVTAQKGFCSILGGDHTLVNQTKKAVLVVAGKVSDIQYVQPDLSKGDFYTDVTITVSQVLKGQPNIDKDTVRFRIEGGIGIDPLTGEMLGSVLSDVPTFEKGQELIIFLQKRTWGEGWPFYDGLYPSVYPPASVYTLEDNGKEYRVAQFLLSFFEQDYLLKLPLDVAFRLVQDVVKAPEEVTLLEKKIREIKDIRKPENRGKEKVESPEFLSMLQAELTRIEEIIKEKEKNDER